MFSRSVISVVVSILYFVPQSNMLDGLIKTSADLKFYLDHIEHMGRGSLTDCPKVFIHVTSNYV